MRRFWDNLSLRSKALAIVAVPALPLLLAMALVLAFARQTRIAEQWVSHTLEVKAQIDATLGLTNDATLSVHSYLVTRERAALDPYVQLGEKWPATIARLVELVRDNPDQVARLKEIAALQGRNPLMTLVRYAATHPSEPVPLHVLQENDQTIDTFRGILARMEQVEDDLLQQRIAARRKAERRQELFSLLCAVFGLGGSVLAAVAFSRGFVRRIDRVAVNASRLSTGDELLPVTGERQDELGRLAVAIREAARLLHAREDQLQEKVVELEAVNTELEAFSYSVSHDLRAPLRHITGFASMLEMSAADRLLPDDRRHLRVISDAANRMGRLIDDLLSFSRMGRAALNKRRVRLADLVKEAQREIGANDHGPAAWTVHDLPDVDADPAMMHLVLVNLLSNAVKYTKPGERPAIEVGASNGGRETVVYVRDNGVGFDMQYGHKLFGVFQRLHSAEEFEGTGIGLANVRRIIHRHGGRVWAEGAVNAGATFYFSLPVGEHT
jgi:signal transduction histidine kinase